MSSPNNPEASNSKPDLPPKGGSGVRGNSMTRPDEFCVTREDGECISTDPRCMHQLRVVREVLIAGASDTPEGRVVDHLFGPSVINGVTLQLMSDQSVRWK